MSPHRTALSSIHLSGLIILSGLMIIVVVTQLTGLAPMLPGVVRGTLGSALVFTVPGYIVLSYLSLFQPNSFSGLTLFLLSASLSLTCNFFANLLIFATNPDLTIAYHVYLATLVAAYGGIFILLGRRSRDLASAVAGALAEHGRTLLLAATAAAIIIVAASLKAHPGVFIEEIFILRKLSEMPEIGLGNISLMPGQATTYMFIPFYIALGFVSEFCRNDVIGAIFEAGPYLTLIAFCVLLKLLLLVSDDQKIATGFAVVFAVCLLAMPLTSADMHSLLIPTADRYGVASTIFLPLAMFHFLMHLRDERASIPMLIGLIYLIVEMSFVHARETLFFLGFALVHIAILAMFSAPARVIRRGMFVIGVVIGALLLYRETVLANAGELSAHVSEMSEHMRAAFMRLIASHDYATLLGLDSNPDLRVPLYENQVFRTTDGGLNLLQYIPFVIPIYILLINSPLRYSIAASAILISIFSASTGLKLVVGSIVGSWFIFHVNSFISLLYIIIFIDFCVMLVQKYSYIEKSINYIRYRTNLRIVGALATLCCASILILITLQLIYHALVGGHLWSAYLKPYTKYTIAQLSFGYSESVEHYIGVLVGLDFEIASLQLFSILLLPAYVVGLGLIVWRLGLHGRKAGATSSVPDQVARHHFAKIKRGEILVWGVAVSLIAGPFLLGTARFTGRERSIGGSETAFWCAEEDVVSAYQCLNDKRLLHVMVKYTGGHAGVPTGLLEFVRSQIPPGKIWFGSDTVPIKLAAPQYAPMLTYAGQMVGAFVANDEIRDKYIVPMSHSRDEDEFNYSHFRLKEFVTTARGRGLLTDALRRYAVDYLIVGPEAYATVRAAAAQNADLVSLLKTIYDRDRYLIYSIKR